MPLRCLLVDDNDAFLETARTLLERQGVQVAGVASNIAGALRQARALRPDVVLVDIGLGEESGFELARLLAADGQDGQRVRGARGSDADVILISAQAERDYTDLIAESPAAGFLHKPELSAQRISQILNRQLRVGQPGFQLAGICDWPPAGQTGPGLCAIVSNRRYGAPRCRLAETLATRRRFHGREDLVHYRHVAGLRPRVGDRGAWLRRWPGSASRSR